MCNTTAVKRKDVLKLNTDVHGTDADIQYAQRILIITLCLLPRYDEYLLTAEVKEFMTLVQQKDLPSEETLAAARLKLGLARAPSGRVSVRSYTGEWFNIKPDSQVRVHPAGVAGDLRCLIQNTWCSGMVHYISFKYASCVSILTDLCVQPPPSAFEHRTDEMFTRHQVLTSCIPISRVS